MSNNTPTIHSSPFQTVTYLGRSAASSVLSTSLNPSRSVGKRVTVRIWADTKELELRCITGMYMSVTVLASATIPNGTQADAMEFARLHLLGGQ
jgi:hypothetical protein